MKLPQDRSVTQFAGSFHRRQLGCRSEGGEKGGELSSGLAQHECSFGVGGGNWCEFAAVAKSASPMEKIPEERCLVWHVGRGQDGRATTAAKLSKAAISMRADKSGSEEAVAKCIANPIP